MSKYCKVQNRPNVMAKIIKIYVGNILSKTFYVPYLNQNVRIWKIVQIVGKCVAEGNILCHVQEVGPNAVQGGLWHVVMNRK